MKMSIERQKYLLSVADKNGFVSIPDAAEHLQVSIETVRRDINKLCADKLLEKTHGGAKPVKLPFKKNGAPLWKIKEYQQARLSIGTVAASMIHNNSIVFIASGISAISVVECISGVENVSFVTYAIPVAIALANKINNGEINGRIILLGGEVNTKHKYISGQAALCEISKYRFDLSIITCTALSADGPSTYELDLTAYFEQILERSVSSVLVAESEKLDKVSSYRFASITSFDRIITDNKIAPSDSIKKAIEKSNTELTIVEVE